MARGGRVNSLAGESEAEDGEVRSVGAQSAGADSAHSGGGREAEGLRARLEELQREMEEWRNEALLLAERLDEALQRVGHLQGERGGG